LNNMCTLKNCVHLEQTRYGVQDIRQDTKAGLVHFSCQHVLAVL